MCTKTRFEKEAKGDSEMPIHAKQTTCIYKLLITRNDQQFHLTKGTKTDSPDGTRYKPVYYNAKLANPTTGCYRGKIDQITTMSI